MKTFYFLNFTKTLIQMMYTFYFQHVRTIVPIHKCLLFLRSLVKKQLWIPLSILGLFAHLSASAQCPCTDCRCSDSLSLVNLYQSTNGAEWAKKWDLSLPIEQWQGIKINAQGRVEEIYLNNNNLIGTLPNLNLPHLQSLHLPNNQLTSNLPNFNLPKLASLVLFNNKFTGQIPNFNLPNLINLILGNNQLSGTIPDFNLPKLQALWLYSNQLSGQIPNFNLPELAYLDLYTNKLSGNIPNFNLPKLQGLNIESNQLSGSIPHFNFPLLHSLILSKNQLTDTIPNFNFPRLTYLSMYENQLTGNIPNFNAPDLTYFSLHSNKLSGNIPNLNMHNLETLYLFSNKLTGCIPREIRMNCPKLGPFGGNIAINPELNNDNWENYWIKGQDACAPIDNNLKLFISPNPATGDVRLAVHVKEAGIYTLQILNTVGDIVIEQTVNLPYSDNTITVSTALLTKGFYLTKVSKGNQFITQKLVVQ